MINYKMLVCTFFVDSKNRQGFSVQCRPEHGDVFCPHLDTEGAVRDAVDRHIFSCGIEHREYIGIVACTCRKCGGKRYMPMVYDGPPEEMRMIQRHDDSVDA